METATLYPGMQLPAFFEFLDRPARITDPLDLPETMTGPETWEKVKDPVRFQQEAYRLTPAEFEEMVSEAK